MPSSAQLSCHPSDEVNVGPARLREPHAVGKYLKLFRANEGNKLLPVQAIECWVAIGNRRNGRRTQVPIVRG
jgi:hypothetical protein